MKRLLALMCLPFIVGCSGFEATFDPATGRLTGVSVRGEGYSVAKPTPGYELAPGADGMIVARSGNAALDHAVASACREAAAGNRENARLGFIVALDAVMSGGPSGAPGPPVTAAPAPTEKPENEAVKNRAKEALEDLEKDIK